MRLIEFTPDTVVEGRWGKNKYKIKKQIGSGGIASVYLVEDIKTKKTYALKISKDSLSINREYQLLRKFSAADMIVDAYEMDDYCIEGEIYYFILLEYIEGSNLKDYSQKNKLKKTTIIGIILILIKGIEVFHREEYIVADLKPENIMIDKKNQHIKIIDLGGVVKKEEGIKEFTPAYDRASWKCGDRRAEASYDLFTIMMIFTKLLLKEDINPKKQNIHDIIVKLKNSSIEKTLRNYIIEGLLEDQKSLEYFERGLKNLYISNRLYNRKQKQVERDKRINFFFIFSIFFFIFTIISIFLI